ncbi:MAG: signal peptidase II [Sphaerochaetaceae bacterium]|nr:signal peptidase II [Sphaerochaetaceae bacterium]
MQKRSTVKKLLPFVLSLAVVAVDQITKQWVIDNIPLGTIYRKFFGDFLWIIHVRNTGAAFSFGAAWSESMRYIVFVIIPIAVLLLLAYAVFSDRSRFTSFQRWAGALILGGGAGTMIDRALRFNEGVVDFISVKFYGLFGMDRWPTFNISDSCVVVGVIMFVIALLVQKEEK